MVAIPEPFAVSLPSESTCATVGLLLVNFTVALAMSRKESSVRAAVVWNCAVSPISSTVTRQSATTVLSCGVKLPFICALTVPRISFDDEPISNTYLPES